SQTAEAAARHAPVRPAGSVLHTTQNRLREKTFLSQAGLPVTPFVPVGSLDDLTAGLARFGGRGVLKTAGWGYDGKGQVKISAPAEAAAAFQRLAPSPQGERASHDAQPGLILESFIDFEKEVSVVAARGLDGSFAHFGVMENEHRNHILDVTIAPARIDGRV